MSPAERMRELAKSHQRLLRAVEALTDGEMREPSRLPGWSRDLLVAHLRFGAEAALRGVQSALSASGGLMYPGGDDQRTEEISTGLARTARELTYELVGACMRLEAAMQGLESGEWEARVQTRRGPVPVSEVLLQRWLDVEVHHVDLDVGYTPSDWPQDLVSEFLPSMIEMLPALHGRPDADKTITGSWALRRTDAIGAWTVSVDRDRSWCGRPTIEPIASIRMEGASLLAVLLGRGDIDAANLTGPPSHARQLKATFPGP